MTENRETPRKAMSDFLKALLWTAIPILLVSGVSAVAAMRSVVGGGIGEPGMAVGSLMFAIAIIASVGFGIAKRRRIAAGILSGAAIGLVGLFVTCFTLL